MNVHHMTKAEAIEVAGIAAVEEIDDAGYEVDDNAGCAPGYCRYIATVKMDDGRRLFAAAYSADEDDTENGPVDLVADHYGVDGIEN